jgi:hypothetical protein
VTGITFGRPDLSRRREGGLTLAFVTTSNRITPVGCGMPCRVHLKEQPVFRPAVFHQELAAIRLCVQRSSPSRSLIDYLARVLAGDCAEALGPASRGIFPAKHSSINL